MHPKLELGSDIQRASRNGVRRGCPMFVRFFRIGASLAAVLTAYMIYSVTVVPLVEPVAEGPKAPEIRATETTVLPPIATRYEQLLRPLLPAGHWVFENPKVLESDQTKLLVKEYRNLPDGRVELKPCAVLFFPSEREAKPGRPAPQIIIMEAPDGAILQFDEAFDLRRAKIGKLIGGQLVGPITIHSPPDRVGTADELKIVTRDVELIEDRVFTPHRVDFKFGPNYGSGREMTIQLAKADSATGKKNHGAQFSGIETFTLASEVKMHVQLGGNGLLPGNKEDQAKPQKTRKTVGAPDPPVEVTCKGAFRFDVALQSATFNDQVNVLRLNPIGQSDQLNCELLSIFFARRDGPNSQATAKSNAEPASALEARRIEARGEPVIVRSPSTDAAARCQRLEYDIPSGAITLESTSEVQLHQGANEIRSRRLDYEPGEAGKLGRLLAVGPGTVVGAMADDPAQKYQAQWTRELRVRPHEQNQVVSLVGDAQVRYTDMGSLAADEIHLWLRESPKGAVGPPKVQPVGLARQAPRMALEPDRMMATGKVVIDAPQMSGATQRLEVWFERGPADASAAGDGNRDNQFAARPAPPTQRFDVAGGLVRVKLSMRGTRTNLADVSVEGNAHFAETKTPQPGEKPLLVKGEHLHVAEADSNNATVEVVGQPALIEARGMSLTGGKVQMERRTNRLWIDGAGRTTLPVNRDLNGQAMSQTQTLEVTWEGGMNFDGRTIAFSRKVVARGEHQRVETELLQVTLQQPINFSNMQTGPGQPRQRGQAEVEQITCSGGIYLESREFDARGQSAQNQMQAVDLAINQITGAIEAHGPGIVTSVRRGAVTNMLARGNVAGETATQQAVLDQQDKSNSRLTYLNVQFEKGITGNLHKRELIFTDQVKTTYGPVATWDQQVSVDDPDGLGPTGVILNCDQLTVREMSVSRIAGGERGPMELEALSNTLVEGSTFTARAHRLTYAEEKDLLVLEGDGRTDAQLFRQPRPGAATTKAAARKIMYWRNTNRVEVDDARYFDLGAFGSGNAEQPPPSKQPVTNDTKPVAPRRPSKSLPRSGFKG